MIILLLVLFVAEVYLIMKMSSYVDPINYAKYRLLGPFALLIPGVLKPGGSKYVLATACGAAVLFATGLYVFEMTELVRG
jgi:hypothetical protein